MKYYAPGNLLHKTFERFIKTHSRPVLGANLDGEKYGPVRDGSVAGRGAKLFERQKNRVYTVTLDEDGADVLVPESPKK